MEELAPVDPEADAPSPARAIALGGRLALLAFGHLLLLVGLLAVTDLHIGWNLDDGAYATQVEVLDQTGGWAYPYRHLDVDPGSRFAPVYLSTLTSEASYPYTKLPAWVEVLRAGEGLAGGPVGLYLPSVLGAMLAAVLAALLAERLRPGSATLGHLVVALGPLVVHAEALWAHTVAAALGGAAALLVAGQAAGRGRRWHPLALAVVVAALVSVRTEGFLFGLAVAVVVAVVAGGEPGARWARAARAAWWAGPPLVAAAAGRVLSDRWLHHLSPGTLVEEQDLALAQVGLVAGRLQGALRTLVDGVGGSSAGTLLGLVAIALALGGGALVAHRRDRAADGWRLVGLGVVLAVGRNLVVAPDDLGGLFLAVPLLAAGLGAWRWSTAAPAARAVAALVVLHGSAVLATQYPEGGSRDWGGRFLFPVLVPALVLTVVVLRDLVGEFRLPGPVAGLQPAGVAVGLLLLAVAVPTAVGVVVAERARSSNRDFDRVVTAVEAEVPTVIGLPRYLPRTGWRWLPERDRLAADVDTADDALALLRPGRRAPVAVVGNGADQVEAPNYRREVRSPVVVVFIPD